VAAFITSLLYLLWHLLPLLLGRRHWSKEAMPTHYGWPEGVKFHNILWG